MSDTPETNALTEAWKRHMSGKRHKDEGMPCDWGVWARSLERRLHEAHDMCDRYAEQLQAALREVEEHKSRCTVLEAEVAEWKSQFAAALAEKGKP